MSTRGCWQIEFFILKCFAEIHSAMKPEITKSSSKMFISCLRIKMNCFLSTMMPLKLQFLVYYFRLEKQQIFFHLSFYSRPKTVVKLSLWEGTKKERGHHTPLVVALRRGEPRERETHSPSGCVWLLKESGQEHAVTFLSFN